MGRKVDLDYVATSLAELLLLLLQLWWQPRQLRSKLKSNNLA